ncbi:hypothetical protein BHE74_00034869 [Ensete ventricosum]|nr:hypothetical protein BHE74_00034869 [Ensete ventricosum]RZS11365.1 hypothetical protein BHM03_00042686 [Ensete ventricosum]
MENTLLDGSPAPRLKICDFGYSKASSLSDLCDQPCKEAAQATYHKKDDSMPTYSLQSVADITQIVREARVPPSSAFDAGFSWSDDEEEPQEGKQE